MKRQVFALFFFFASLALASSNTDVKVFKAGTEYETYQAQVYDGKTGKEFSYRVTVSMKIDECAAIEFSSVEVAKSFGIVTYLFSFSGISPAIGCDESQVIYSQSFDFPKGAGFIELIIPKDASVKVERLAE